MRSILAMVFVVAAGLTAALAYQPINMTGSTMTFTGGPEFASVDTATPTMQFTGQ